MYTIGIDLGTSALKLLLVDETGAILHTVSQEYPVEFPQPGWSQQDPAHWWQACVQGIPQLLHGFDARAVRGIGVGGQMHGLVALDSSGRVLRPAILWNDGRTAEQTAYLNDELGRDFLSANTANIAFAGFTAPKLLWMRSHEPELFARIHKILLPKDYLVYRLTGAYSTDYSDASGTLLLDVEHKCWSPAMLDICGLDVCQMPRLSESSAAVGQMLPTVAAALGLPPGVTVCAGAGDNAAAAIGTGTIGAGRCNISLGTSGTIFISSDHFRADAASGLHTFAHADGGWHVMGCMLSAASCSKWWLREILGTGDYAGEEARISPDALGRNSVFFLPYLMGERSPINDTNARGTLIGMTMGTTRADITQAVLEGVSFAIRDSLEAARRLGLQIPRSSICGGGSRSPLWKKILANVLGIPLDLAATEQGPGYGAAILAMVACGLYENVQAAVNALTSVKDTVEPDPVLTALYEARYAQFRQIYPVCQPLFPSLLQTDET